MILKPEKQKAVPIDFTFESRSIGHLGIMAAAMDELSLVNNADKVLQGNRYGQKISLGQRIKSMILNLIAFENRTLYNTPNFLFEHVHEALFGSDFEPESFNDDALGRALDEIYDYGPTKFFQSMAMMMLSKSKLGGNSLRLDSTSMMLQGEYKNSDNRENDGGIKVTFGYSKDGRPDCKQVMLSLVTTGIADLPIVAKPQSGNASDKTEFPAIVADFQRNFTGANSPLWIFDSAGYNKKWLADQKESGTNFFPWLTRIPETIEKAKSIVDGVYPLTMWETLSNGYRSIEFKENYGGVDQLWTLYFSQQAYQRELKTLEKNIAKEQKDLENRLWHLSNKEFGCEEDAKRQVDLIMKGSKYHKIEEVSVTAISKHVGAGRPKKGSAPQRSTYKVTTTILQNKNAIDEKSNICGRFILGTNAANIQFIGELSANADQIDALVGDNSSSTAQTKGVVSKRVLSRSQSILDAYKELQGTENAFKLIKNREFMMNRFFLHKESRIEALLVIIALAIFIYNYTSYVVVQKLQKAGVNLQGPNGAILKTNTSRRVFEIFRHVAAIKIHGEGGLFRMPNMSDIQRKILEALGPYYMARYGLF
jgi:transposase